jgi:hypothetical protein
LKPRDTGNVFNLMDALARSLNDVGKGGASQPANGRKANKAASGQKLSSEARPQCAVAVSDGVKS